MSRCPPVIAWLVISLCTWLVFSGWTLPLQAAPPRTPAERAEWTQAVQARVRRLQAEIEAGRGSQVLAEAEALATEMDEVLGPQRALVVAHLIALQAAAQAKDLPAYSRQLRAVVQIWQAAELPYDAQLLGLCQEAAKLSVHQQDLAQAARDYDCATQAAHASGAPHALQIELHEKSFQYGVTARLDLEWAERDLAWRHSLIIRTLPPRWAWWARLLKDEAVLAQARARPAEALAAIERAVQWCQRSKPADANPLVASQVYGTAAWVYRETDRLHAAEAAARQAVDLAARVTDDDGWELDRQLGELATVLHAAGRQDEALALLDGRWAEVATDEAGQLLHLMLALNRATLHQSCGDHATAVAAFRQVIEVLRKLPGPEAPYLAMIELSLVNSLMALDRWTEAGEAVARNHARFQRVLPEDQGDHLIVSSQVARVRRNVGQPQAAYATLLAALERGRRFPATTGRAMPGVLIGLALCELDLGRPRQALAWLRQEAELTEAALARQLRVGTEADRRELLNRHNHDLLMRLAVALQDLPGDPEAAEVAADVQLRRKGRLLDALAARRTVPPLTAEVASLQQRLIAARAQLARTLGAPAPVALAAQRQVDELERLWAERMARLTEQAPTPGLAEVKAALPVDAVLLEYAVWTPWAPPRPGEGGRSGHEHFGKQSHLAVLIVQRSAPPRWLDLGPLAPTEALAQRWHKALSDPASPDVDTLGRQVDAALLQPVRRVVRAQARLVVSPVGALYRVPFAALVDENGRYLVETRKLSVLPAGRDLVTVLRAQGPAQGVLVVANPAFDGAVPAGTSPTVGRRSVDATQMRFHPLPGAQAEGVEVAAQWPDSALWLGEAASETAVKAVDDPRILHLATHGFWLPGRAGLAENPLLRSGIALAGSNRPAQSGEDGLLTALEAGQLDLGRTRLVVLSACETGLGQLHGALDGVEGLQRALLAAGATAVVGALWQVDDAATRALMVDFYARLRKGVGRGDALAAAQKAAAGLAAVARTGERGAQALDRRGAQALGSPGTAQPGENRRKRHPYYWAGFQLTGSWLPL